MLFRSTPASHTVFLTPLAQRCDLVVDGPGSPADSPWHPGIDPGAWVAEPGDRGLVILGAPDGSGGPSRTWRLPDASPDERSLEAGLAELAARMGTVLPDAARPDAARAALQGATAAAGLPLAVPGRIVGAASVKLGVLAAGIPLVSGPDPALAELASGGLGIAATPEAVETAFREAGETLTPQSHRANLRTIVSRLGVPVCLSAHVIPAELADAARFMDGHSGSLANRVAEAATRFDEALAKQRKQLTIITGVSLGIAVLSLILFLAAAIQLRGRVVQINSIITVMAKRTNELKAGLDSLATISERLDAFSGQMDNITQAQNRLRTTMQSAVQAMEQGGQARPAPAPAR